MFCSETCRDEANRVYHKLECGFVNKFKKNDLVMLTCLSNQRFALEALNSCGGSFEKLGAMMTNPELNSTTVFDVDFRDRSRTNEGVLTAINSLKEQVVQDAIYSKTMKDYVSVKQSIVKSVCLNNTQFNILKDFSWKICQIRQINTFPLFYYLFDDSVGDFKANCFGSALFPFGSLFNHSCAPNVCRMNVDDKLVFVVQRPIEKDSQLFICYKFVEESLIVISVLMKIIYFFRIEAMFELSERSERLKTMKSDYNFECQCEACIGKYRELQELKTFDSTFEMSSKVNGKDSKSSKRVAHTWTRTSANFRAENYQ